MGIIAKIAAGLKKTKDNFLGRLKKIFNSFTKIDEELFEELEEAMIMSDIGVETSEEICDRLRKMIKERRITDPNEIMELIQEIIGDMMGDDTGTGSYSVTCGYHGYRSKRSRKNNDYR